MTFSQIVFLSLLAAILNFCVKPQNTFILETVPDRAISTKFLSHRGSAGFTGDFSQKLFSANFGGHLEFLRKMQKSSYLGIGVRYSDFDEIFDPQGICSVLATFLKNHFLAIFGGHLEFYIHLLATFPKHFFSVTSKFWTLWVPEILDVVLLKNVEFPEFRPPY